MVNDQFGSEPSPTVQNRQDLSELAVNENMPSKSADSIGARFQFAQVLVFSEVTHKVESDTAHSTLVKCLQMAVALRTVKQCDAFISTLCA